MRSSTTSTTMRLLLAANCLLVGAAALGACGEDTDAVRGSGELETDDRTVRGFDRVELEGAGDLIIDVGGTESLTIEAEDNLLPLLRSDVRGSTLHLDTSEPISPTRTITYTLGAAALEGVTVAGSGDVDVPNLSCTSFEVVVAGSGRFDLGGDCEGIDVSINGSGDVDAADLAVATASIAINGSGDVLVDVSDELRVTINGSGDVVYTGDPTTDIDINGSGDVRRRSG